ncbi:hypothetical protein ACFL6C_09090 [Myxococcota bacterium]
MTMKMDGTGRSGIDSNPIAPPDQGTITGPLATYEGTVMTRMLKGRLVAFLRLDQSASLGGRPVSEILLGSTNEVTKLGGRRASVDGRLYRQVDTPGSYDPAYHDPDQVVFINQRVTPGPQPIAWDSIG